MEMWPRLIDWRAFQDKYIPDGNPEDWSEEPEYAHPCDTGSMNLAVVNAFQLMQARLPPDVREALGTFIVSISSVIMEGWSQDDYAPYAVKNQCIYAPETVRQVLSKLDSVDQERFTSEIKRVWDQMSADPKDWTYVDVDYWDQTDSCGDFLDYIFGWRDAFAEAVEGGRGLFIDAG